MARKTKKAEPHKVKRVHLPHGHVLHVKTATEAMPVVIPTKESHTVQIVPVRKDTHASHHWWSNLFAKPPKPVL